MPIQSVDLKFSSGPPAVGTDDLFGRPAGDQTKLLQLLLDGRAVDLGLIQSMKLEIDVVERMPKLTLAFYLPPTAAQHLVLRCGEAVVRAVPADLPAEMTERPVMPAVPALSPQEMADFQALWEEKYGPMDDPAVLERIRTTVEVLRQRQPPPVPPIG